MLDLVLGIAAAVGASTFYSLGIALQALDAKQAPHSEHLRPALALGLLRRARWLAGTGLSGLGCASLLPYLLHLVHRSPASVTMVGAGLAFGWSGVATKLASDDLAQGHLLPAAAWALSTAAASGVGVLSEMSALQARPAIQVAPVVFVTQTVVPVALAPLLLGESFARTPLGGVPLACSLALLVVGAAALVRSPLLLALLEGERGSHDSGSTTRPRDSSQETI